MKTSFNILHDVAGYLANGLHPLPFIYSQFLLALEQQERNNTVSLLPLPRLELYHIHLEQKIQQRIETYQKRKVA